MTDPEAIAQPGSLRPPRPTILRVTAIVALIGVLVAVAAIIYAGRPLRTPTQDCGTAATFLIDGRVNVFLDPARPPEGVTAKDIAANAARPCQERAADRALPAGIATVAGTLVALVALAVEFFVRLRLHRRPHPRPVVAAGSG